MEEFIMSESQVTDGDKLADGQQSVIADGSKPQLVKYETYDKAMATLAKEKQARMDLEKKLQDIQEKEMLAQGQYKELLEQKETELRDLKERALRDQAAKIEANVKAKVSAVAAKYGAYDASDVLKNLSLKELGIDAEGNVDEKIVEQKVSEIRAQKAYLFKQASTKIADGNPMMKIDMKPKVANTIDELKQQYLDAAMKK
jgi:hypothetical protein